MTAVTSPVTLGAGEAVIEIRWMVRKFDSTSDVCLIDWSCGCRPGRLRIVMASLLLFGKKHIVSESTCVPLRVRLFDIYVIVTPDAFGIG